MSTEAHRTRAASAGPPPSTGLWLLDCGRWGVGTESRGGDKVETDLESTNCHGPSVLISFAQA